MEQKTKKKPRKKTPDILYHYTSQEGLLGIIEEGIMRATNIFYLNDATEFAYAYEMITSIMDKHLLTVSTCPVERKDRGEPLDDKTLISLESFPEREGEFKFLKSVSIYLRVKKTRSFNYICSFSEIGDQLSQWRGYCPDGVGVSIGFSLQELLKQFKSYKLVKCIYDEGQQRKIIEKVLPPNLDSNDEFIVSSRDLKLLPEEDIHLPGTYENLLSLVPQFKHKKFREEQEWRIIGNMYSAPVKHRCGKSMLVPYIEIPLFNKDEDGKRLPSELITEIIVGPTPHPELSMNSVKSLLEENYIDNCTIRQSEVPYRSW